MLSAAPSQPWTSQIPLGGSFDRHQIGGRIVTAAFKQCRGCLDTIPIGWSSDICVQCAVWMEEGGSG